MKLQIELEVYRTEDELKEYVIDILNGQDVIPSDVKVSADGKEVCTIKKEEFDDNEIDDSDELSYD